MYTLKLTAEERKAIDWVGNRYDHGDLLYRLLWLDSAAVPAGVDWDSPTEITFIVPENVAWQIERIGADCNYFWDCFGASLCRKLNDFCMSIV